jgi:hypothetical protein
VLVTAVLFGLTHLNPWQFSSAMGLGAVLGWWFWRTQSLAPCLLGHALLNGWVLANPYLPFAIPGFNKGEPYASAELQPLWFDLAGLALAGTGAWLFQRMTAPPPRLNSESSRCNAQEIPKSGSV